jgi:pyruvate,water dikinase
LLALIASFLANVGKSPREQNAEMAGLRRRTQSELQNRCRGLSACWRRPLLRWLFRYNEIYMSERDNHRFYFDRVWYQLRRIHRSYGRRLAATGVLANGDDVFYLGSAEIEQGLKGELDGPEAQARVAVRKRVWHETLRAQSPKFLIGYAAHDDGAQLVEGNARLGIGASPGIVTGRARVIYDVRELPAVQEGEILVTRQTDPAWSTVFARISGLVLETGGVLAHGASLCREFNLPCVTALERATEVIHDGDMLTIDGARGRVVIGDAA